MKGIIASLLVLTLGLLADGRVTASEKSSTGALEVDLGYGVYQGEPQGVLNGWLGMRFAAPPTGDNRWRAPQPPVRNRSAIIAANQYGPQCPQTPQSPLTPGFPYQGNEDCLYVNVWAPPNADNLPVMFYIHGGGYGLGNGQFNVSQAPLAAAANYQFVSVVIQYRLGAFGFLASSDIHNNGSLNAGILDQHLALQWTKKHVSKFGGDPSRVTLVGQSAGAGSVMLQAMAKGGEESTSLFQQGIASSPYTPAQYVYSDSVPMHRYQRFAKQAGCGGRGSSTLDCLRQADTNSLQKANAVVGAGVNYGSFGFVPVTDGDFINERPSQQLTSGKINGQRILTSNNGNEGSQFVNPNISTAGDFNRWLKTEFPLLSKNDVHQINTVYYPPRDVGDTPYASCGDCGGPTAVNVGSSAVGNLQRAIDLYSEVTFDCPSYWLAEGSTMKSGTGYKYQFSVPPSGHGFDLGADGLGSCPNFLTPQIGPDMCAALTQVWANFITTGDPSISNALANGNSSTSSAPNAASDWPIFEPSGANKWQMLNLNQTDGTLVNNITKVDGYNWEGGRGERCDFWRKLGYPS